MISHNTASWYQLRTLNLVLLLTLQIKYTAGTTKAPTEHWNVQRVCRMVGLVAENAYTAVRSSSGTAPVHTAGEQRRCFQIPDSLSMLKFQSNKIQLLKLA